MSVMTATRARARADSPFALLPTDRPLTVEDLDLTPDDGNKYELDDGVLVVSPAAVIAHQFVLQRLSVLLAAACPPEFYVLPGPGVEMSKVQYRIPDLVVVRDEDFDIEAKSVTRPPVLAIEVASPSTALYDRNRKKDVYAGFGIATYWIVTPSLDKPSLTVFELREGAYAEQALVSGDQVYRAERPFAVEICPASLVALRRPG
jgi:Uma2 family endonuclease